MVKICSKCKKEKELSEFPTSKRDKYGVSYECKACRHQYYLKNKEKIIAGNKIRYAKNIEKNRKYKQEYRKRNKKYITEYQSKYRKNHPEEKLNTYYLWKYGVSFKEIKGLHIKQKGKCAICKEELRWGKSCHVDHDHKTGKIRGLLCYKCNLMMGFAEDNVKKLLAGIKYLKVRKDFW